MDLTNQSTVTPQDLPCFAQQDRIPPELDETIVEDEEDFQDENFDDYPSDLELDFTEHPDIREDIRSQQYDPELVKLRRGS